MRKPRSAFSPAGMKYYRRRRKIRRLRSPAIILGGAALVGITAGVASALDYSALSPKYSDTISGCNVTDGDTIRCGGERIRLLAIDAPEMGECRPGRVCAPGDPVASTNSLRQAMRGVLQIDRVGVDHYGRTLARVTGSEGDLSCWQLKHDHAIYKSGWDNGMRIARTCPKAIIGM